MTSFSPAVFQQTASELHCHWLGSDSPEREKKKKKVFGNRVSNKTEKMAYEKLGQWV